MRLEEAIGLLDIYAHGFTNKNEAPIGPRALDLSPDCAETILAVLRDCLWTRVEDGLPALNRPVLVRVEHETPSGFTDCAGYLRENGWYTYMNCDFKKVGGGMYPADRVTRWRPLRPGDAAPPGGPAAP